MRAGRLDDAVNDVSRFGGQALAIPTDVAQWPDVQRAARQIEEEFGPIDVWVNNAMSSMFAPFKDVPMEDFKRATEVTYLGFVHGTKAALDVMLPRDSGAIVQVGSALAYRGIPLQSAYCGAKHAMVGFTESLRTELLHDHSGVCITMVHMPAMNTPQFDWVRSKLPHRPQPVAPIYQPEVGARAVVFAAAHPQRRCYYIGAPTILTVFGNKVAPQALDRYLARTGYKAQQADEVEDHARPDNLYHTVERPVGAHGRFDDRSHGRATLSWLARHRVATTLTLGSTGLLGRLVRRWAATRRPAQPSAHEDQALWRAAAHSMSSACTKACGRLPRNCRCRTSNSSEKSPLDPVEALVRSNHWAPVVTSPAPMHASAIQKLQIKKAPSASPSR
jgi:NAD(P)-dependent dehydrogenase (short-subunit alcohol dehydrogenase family)